MRKLIAILCLQAGATVCQEWNARGAAGYLDSRQKEWFAWKPASGKGGPCVSCHTGVTYLLARPALRKLLGEPSPTEYEQGLTVGLAARVEDNHGRGAFPRSIREPAASQAFGIEAVLAALFVNSEAALDRMLSAQIREGEAKGAWAWFSLNLDPWEMAESPFYGATLAALALDKSPGEYRRRPDVKQRYGDLLAYLRRPHPEQPLHNRLMLLWIEGVDRKPVINELWSRQNADGSWTRESLGPWKPHESAPAPDPGDAYATSFAAASLLKGGVKASDERLRRALDWLRSHQDTGTGSWAAASMNKSFPENSMMSRFMRDAATAYAALALAESGRR